MGGNVVARMPKILTEIGIVKVEFTHGRAVGPGRPLPAERLIVRDAEQRRAARPGMRERL